MPPRKQPCKSRRSGNASGRNLPASLHPRVYTIKIGTDAFRATAESRDARQDHPNQSIGGWCRLVEYGCTRRFPLGEPAGEQRIELSLAIGQGMQFLPVA